MNGKPESIYTKEMMDGHKAGVCTCGKPMVCGTVRARYARSRQIATQEVRREWSSRGGLCGKGGRPKKVS